MAFLFRAFLFGTCIYLTAAWNDRLPRRKRSPVQIAVIEDTKCAGACLNLLRTATEADDSFRQQFMDLGRLGSVVPQTMISKVELATFQRYCLNVYMPVRECLIACSSNFTADLLRSMTMLETMCVDHYQAMNRYMSCMRFAYEKTTPVCEKQCFQAGSSSELPNNETSIDATPVAITNDSSSSAPDVVQRNDESTYLKPNETMSLFCLLLECVTFCEIPLLERHCGRESAVLEAVLIDAMARTEKITVQLEDANVWPIMCDNLILPNSNNNGQARNQIMKGFLIPLLIVAMQTWRSF